MKLLWCAMHTVPAAVVMVMCCCSVLDMIKQCDPPTGTLAAMQKHSMPAHLLLTWPVWIPLLACLQHVFLITVKASIWRSKDGGSTFEDISERFKSEHSTTVLHAGVTSAPALQCSTLTVPSTPGQCSLCSAEHVMQPLRCISMWPMQFSTCKAFPQCSLCIAWAVQQAYGSQAPCSHVKRLYVYVCAAGSIKSELPVAVTQVLSHKSKPNQIIFVGAADYMW
jgi:hypothetical protein